MTVFEKDNLPGGLALGFKDNKWDWSLEKYYHHWFTNDKNVLNLAKQINHEVLIKRPKTSVYIDGLLYQLDNPKNVLTFPKLSITDRVRMSAVLGFLKYNPFWQPLEKIEAANFLSKTMGENAYQLLWEPQLSNKFGKYKNDISLAWFWARIKKRTAQLAYPKGGFLSFANALVKKIEENGGKVLFDTEVSELKSNKQISIKYKILNTKYEILKFDKVLVTLPSFFFLKIAKELPQGYKDQISQLKGLGAMTLLLRLKNQFMQDGTYWASICEKNSPVMAIVEHTNFMDKKYYNNENLVYIGNYLPYDDIRMKMSAEELLKSYDPLLKKINPTYSLSLITYNLFKTPFAQPIIPLNYSKILPKIKTPLKNVFLANIQQVYPWDRGTNYAVELGEKVAGLIDNC